MTLLSVRGLSVAYSTEEGELPAVRDVSLELERGEGLALVGESGSGKSTIGLAILGLLPPNARLLSGSIEFEGRELTTLPEEERRRLRWSRISMIFQGSMNALDPLMKVGDQLYELLRYHRGLEKGAAREVMTGLLGRVGLGPSVLDLYPHELSGGMRQRVVIAMALALEPSLLIADEPTTGLDVTTQAEIILMLRALVRERRMAILFITHDLALAPQLCGRVVVLYGGTTMEAGPIEGVLSRPLNPYTQALLRSLITLERRSGEPIAGDPPTLRSLPSGCPFHSRCASAFSRCREALPRELPVQGHSVRCHLYGGRER